ncbi:hypothetical protein BC938DRAFT_473962 [Jimgerdemannia flammicorona]|uniref:RING-type domain-containing protein n=1 Tax=Jimgerdemannia flammicorona TaxID=994334 RepID=A0A433Q349_9FUNG|nr:hypothetical protein BC938DRAFT_473962 [Jimgerdemannia flammicorona]
MPSLKLSRADIPETQYIEYSTGNETLGWLRTELTQKIEQGSSKRVREIQFLLDGEFLKDWSKTAPDWRIVTKGLNLEGTCTNDSCPAHNHRVIMKWEQRNFDFQYDSVKCRCPICFESVMPITCGFSNTWWSFRGIKSGTDTSGAGERVSCDWRRAGDAYHVFDEGKGGVASWSRLKILTRFCEHDWICTICFERKDAVWMGLRWRVTEPDTLACGHSFHLECIDEWKNAQREKVLALTCPICRVEIVEEGRRIEEVVEGRSEI